PEDSQDRTSRAMPSELSPAHLAAPACGIDLANYPPAGESFSSISNLTDELVPGNATISHIAPRQFEVGPADPGHPDANQRFAGWRNRIRIVVADERTRVENKSAHGLVSKACSFRSQPPENNCHETKGPQAAVTPCGRLVGESELGCRFV